MGGNALDGLGEANDRVVGVRDRAVACTSVRGEPDPRDSLLGRLEQVGTSLVAVTVLQGDAVAPDLGDRLADALEDLGMLLDHEVRALDTAGLLIGEEDEEQVARGSRPRAGEVTRAGEDHRDHVLHVDCAAAP